MTEAPDEKGTVLVIGSNARMLRLKDGRSVPTGHYLNETVVPMQALRAAGFDLLVATPDGSKPPLDERSLSPAHFDGNEKALQRAAEFFVRDAAFGQIQTLGAVIAAGLGRIAGLYVPGGHAPIVDLAANAELGEILRYAHAAALPTAMLCHGPIATLAAMHDAQSFEQALIADDSAGARAAAETWPYRGYRMTIFSNSEEAPVERNTFGAPLPFSVAEALGLAGGRVEHGSADYAPFVVNDRELITGQNPRSDHVLAARLIEALDARTPAKMAEQS